MADIFANLMGGFAAALTLTNIMFIAFGIAPGIAIGVIPGLGSVTVMAVPFAAFALQFGPLELASVLLFAFALLSGLSGASPIKGVISIFVGVFLATIGLDPVDNTPRMVFDHVALNDGLPLASLVIGALASVLEQLTGLWRHGDDRKTAAALGVHDANRLSPREFVSQWRTIICSAVIGSGIGMLPGLGVTPAAVLSYGAARRASNDPASLGRGNPQGIIATEAASSAVVGSNLIPTIAIPGNIAAALLIGAFMIHGIVPGPFMLTMHGDIIYALFASVLIANVIHLVIGRLGISLWAHIARAPRSIVLPPVILLCVVGVYLPGQLSFEVGVMLAFAVVGLLMRLTGFSIVCLVIGFLLGEMFETSLRQSLLLYKGDLGAVLDSPTAMVFLALTVFILARAGWRVAAQGR